MFLLSEHRDPNARLLAPASGAFFYNLLTNEIIRHIVEGTNIDAEKVQWKN